MYPNFCLEVGLSIQSTRMSCMKVASMYTYGNLFSVMNNKNHPKKGSFITVDPIRNMQAVRRIRALLKHKPRDRCLFVMGINTGFRACELLSITCGQVSHLQAGDLFTIKQSKTGKLRTVVLYGTVVKVVQAWLREHPDPRPNAPLFLSRSGRALTVSTVCNMVKGWCAEVGLKGRYGSHTMRKTWGFMQLRHNHLSNPQALLTLVMEALDHTDPKVTRRYLGVQFDEVAQLYLAVQM